MMLAVAVQYDLELNQMDVHTAFLIPKLGDIHEATTKQRFVPSQMWHHDESRRSLVAEEMYLRIGASIELLEFNFG